MVLLNTSDDNIRKAAEWIKNGNLVIFPTETVYGLGCNATDDKVVSRLYKAKLRPAHNPLIIHVAKPEHGFALADFDQRAKNIASRFWPGPLTLVLAQKKQNGISGTATAGLDTIALRCPAHPVAHKLLLYAGVPVAAPSANKSGRLSPTRPVHTEKDFENDVACILAGGSCSIGLESTVLDLSCEVPSILRHGAVTESDLSEYIDLDKSDRQATEKPKAPGQLSRHYAPLTPIRINAVDLEPGEALLAFGSEKFIGIRGGGSARDLPEDSKRNLSESKDLNEAAVNLFAMLHDLDSPERHKSIAVMPVPDIGIGKAINDRLVRAARRE